MRLKYSIGIVLIAFIHLSNSQGPRGTNQRDSTNGGSSTANLDLVADSVTNLANKISLAISSPDAVSKTEIFSPVSIAGALSLLLLGAGGTTKNELLNVMGFSNKPIGFTDIHKSFGQLFQELVSNEQRQANIPWRQNDKCNNIDYDDEDDTSSRGGFKGRQRRDSDIQSEFDRYAHEIQLANGLFIEDNFSLSPRYEELAKNLYQSQVERLDFSGKSDVATNRINAWIDQHTRGKIPEIFSSSVGSNTVMVIASALYFKALWEDMFIEGATRLRDFYPNGRNSTPIQVEMMAHGGCFPYYDASELDARILGIPYKNNLTTMYIIKPYQSNRRTLQDLIYKLNARQLNEMINRMKKKTSVILFPKMHVSSTLNLKKVLKILGLRTMFHPSKSDLSTITGENKSQSFTAGVSKQPEDQYANRPAVNLPPISSRKPLKPLVGQKPFVFSRFENTTDHVATDTTEEPVNTEIKPANQDEELSTTAMPTEVPGSAERSRRDVSYKTPSESKGNPNPLKSKDFFLNKRILKPTAGKKVHRSRRDVQSLYVSDAVHKIELEINERGTEGGAATAITLNRSGTSVVFRADEPFLLIIRNDKTKLPLFFGAVYDPTH